MAKLANRKVVASTLMEVLIAMTIIMIVFVISIQVFNNVLNSGVSLKKLEVQNQLNLLKDDIKRKGYISESSLIIDSVNYECQTQETDVANVVLLEIKASQGGNLMGSTKCLFKTDMDHEKD